MVVVREDAGDDWLAVCLPLEALSRIETRVRAFPFGDDGGAESLIWRRPCDDWLAQIGRAVYRGVGFELGAIGFEVSGIVDAESVADGVPDNRGYGVLQPTAEARGRLRPAKNRKLAFDVIEGRYPARQHGLV